MMRLRLTSGFMAAFFVAGSVTAMGGGTDSVALTIYSTARPGAIPSEIYVPDMSTQYLPMQYRQIIPGYAIVKHERYMNLKSGRNHVKFPDIASQLDPTTVAFQSLTDPETTHVLEQDYRFDLVSTQKLMDRYIDQKITVDQVRGDEVRSTTGVLLSTQGGIVLGGDDETVQVITDYSSAHFPQLPGGLVTKPTLNWTLVTKKGTQHRVRVSYETKAITWWADYNVVYSEGRDANSGLLDLGAWVSIVNQSGATYDKAKLKLVAGDVHRAQPESRHVRRKRIPSAIMADESAATGFEEKSFFEYHLYTLMWPATIPDNSTKQIELFETKRGVPCEKAMVYSGQAQGFYRGYGSPMTDRNFGIQSNKKVDIYLRFKNEKAIGLGLPLPSGRMRVSKLDPADKSLEFIGESTIDHTPKDEEVLIKLGSAFDVVGERRQLDFSVDNQRDWLNETIEIKLRNHKKEPVRVLVKENLYRWTNWKITEKSHPFEKIDSRTVHFPVTVGPDGETVIRYTVHYSW